MTSDDRDVLRHTLGWIQEGRAAALATVTRTWGSAPRPPGSHMAVCAGGDFAGSVSGGCVEAAVIQEAEAVLAGGHARLLSYGVTDEEAWAVGLSCGGRLEVYLEAPPPSHLADLVALLDGRGSAVVLTWLDSGRRDLWSPGRDLPPELEHTAKAALRSARTVVLDTAEGPVLVRPYPPPPRLVIVGAVHVTQPLVRMATEAGFEVEVVDPRRAWATPERFPGVQLRAEWPDAALARPAPDFRTAVVTLSHDPKLDDPALLAALASDAFYIGALGSRRTHERRLTRLEDELRARDGDPASLHRIHAPVGLDIGARTPAEIAVAVLAEVIASLRGRDAGS